MTMPKKIDLTGRKPPPPPARKKFPPVGARLGGLARRLFRLAALFVIAGLVYYKFVLPGLVPTQKLSGNQSALAMCGWEMTAWKSYQANRSTFNFHQLSDDEKRRVIMFGLGEDFMIRTNFLWGDDHGRAVVIVSRRVYDNVPTPAPWNLYHRNPAHAAGFSDGTTGLLSPEQFDNLFLYGFVPLWSLATNADAHFKIFKQ
jgi:hypothetical protein